VQIVFPRTSTKSADDKKKKNETKKKKTSPRTSTKTFGGEKNDKEYY
jgi:hypothetical protein